MSILRRVIDEGLFVGGLELPVLDGAVVGVSAEDWTEGLEGSLGSEFGVQIVEDREIVQGVPVVECEAQTWGVLA